jgi:hypothetical protein
MQACDGIVGKMTKNNEMTLGTLRKPLNLISGLFAFRPNVIMPETGESDAE